MKKTTIFHTSVYFSSMVTHPLYGHLPQRVRLAQAVAKGRLPQVLLLTGEVGIGKQRLALWLAQLVLCDRPGPEPCGSCRPCSLVTKLVHPDLHWFMPVPRPKSTDPDRQVEELAQSIGEVVNQRREEPLYGPADGMAGHFVATARLLQQRASLTPVEGKKKVFILAEANRLVPQEANPEAANALLKLFEEPPADCLFVLTSVEPGQLLPTVRSRAVTLRLGRLTDEEVERFLIAAMSLPPGELRQRVLQARGLIGTALGQDIDGKARQAAGGLLEAVLAGRGSRLERALKQSPWAARGEFTTMLDALGETLNDAARSALGQEPRYQVHPIALGTRSAAALAAAADRVAVAREAAQGNVNPQLLLAVLSEELAELL